MPDETMAVWIERMPHVGRNPKYGETSCYGPCSRCDAEAIYARLLEAIDSDCDAEERESKVRRILGTLKAREKVR